MSSNKGKVMKAVPRDGQKVNSPFIAMKICEGANPFTLGMLDGITVDMVDEATEMIKKYIPQEKKEEYEKHDNGIDQMKPQIVIPEHLVTMFGLDNNVVTKLMVAVFNLESLTPFDKLSIRASILFHETKSPGEEKEEEECSCCHESEERQLVTKEEVVEWAHELTEGDEELYKEPILRMTVEDEVQVHPLGVVE